MHVDGYDNVNAFGFWRTRSATHSAAAGLATVNRHAAVSMLDTLPLHKQAHINPVADVDRWCWGRWRDSEEQILLYLAEEQAEGAGLLCSFGGCSLLRDLPVLFGRAGAVLDCACGCCCQLLGRQGARQSLGTECWQSPPPLTRHAHLHRDECDATALICYSCKQCKQRI